MNAVMFALQRMHNYKYKFLLFGIQSATWLHVTRFFEFRDQQNKVKNSFMKCHSIQILNCEVLFSS